MAKNKQILLKKYSKPELFNAEQLLRALSKAGTNEKQGNSG